MKDPVVPFQAVPETVYLGFGTKHPLQFLCSFTWFLDCQSNAGTTEMLLSVLSSGKPMRKPKYIFPVL